MTQQPPDLGYGPENLSWDRNKHGKMADYATPDETVPVERWTPDDSETEPEA